MEEIALPLKSTYRLLLVEDTLADQNLVERAIDEWKSFLELHIVEDGAQAIDFIKGNTKTMPDLILLDLNLPKMKGDEFLTWIKNDGRYRYIPVVVFTSSTSPQDIHSCYTKGANCYLSKGNDLKEFFEAVRSIILFWCNSALLCPLVPYHQDHHYA